MNRLFVCVAVLSLAGCETVPRWFPCSAHSSDDVLQALAYSGPVLPLAQVATIYAFDGGEGADAGWICAVDGHDLRRQAGSSVRCPAVVYVTPGAHVVDWHYQGLANRSGLRGPGDDTGTGTLRVQAMPGGVYRLVPDVARTTATLVVVHPGGGMLRYADINPRFATTALPYPPAR
jgi:hypothetical protein